MIERYKLIWVYLISAVFIAVNTLLIMREINLGIVLPLAFFIIILYFISLDKVIILITFLTPIAINIRDMGFGFGLSVPTEPLMLGVLIFFFLRLIMEGKYEWNYLKHPITLAIVFNLIWIFMTSITSEMPLVSFKYFISRLWFVIPFYFVMMQMFKKEKNIHVFIWAYIIPFLGIIFYTIINHYLHGFTQKSGHWVMKPFYNDHTVYGAMVAFFIPVLFLFAFEKKNARGSRIMAMLVMAVFIIALVLSYSRAAWLGVAFSLLVFIIIKLKIKFSWLLVMGIVVFGFLFTFQQQILNSLERNEQDSSTNFAEHIQSIANISSDASNLERINRWKSAIRLFEARPFWGWGPGTYQFVYGPMQRSTEKTIISTNFGDMGNAHSEYIGPLSESGLFGMLSMLLIAVLSVYFGLKIYHKAKDQHIRFLGLAVTLSLISYFVHGFLNNFLDTDKASVPFWGFIAIIVVLNIRYVKKSHIKS